MSPLCPVDRKAGCPVARAQIRQVAAVISDRTHIGPSDYQARRPCPGWRNENNRLDGEPPDPAVGEVESSQPLAAVRARTARRCPPPKKRTFVCAAASGTATVHGALRRLESEEIAEQTWMLPGPQPGREGIGLPARDVDRPRQFAPMPGPFWAGATKGALVPSSGKLMKLRSLYVGLSSAGLRSAD